MVAWVGLVVGGVGGACALYYIPPPNPNNWCWLTMNTVETYSTGRDREEEVSKNCIIEAGDLHQICID